jgi:hypothetical protein
MGGYMRKSSIFLTVSVLLLPMLTCTLVRAQSQETRVFKGSVNLGVQKPSLEDQPADTGDITAPRVEKTDALTPAIPQSPTPNPLDPLLWPGNYFDKKVATALLKDSSQHGSTWRKIPDWQAGQWQCLQATNTQDLGYLNGIPAAQIDPKGVYTCQSKFTVGQEKDKKGEIWERFTSGYWTEADHGSRTGFSYVNFQAPGVYDYPDSYGESITFEVDKATNKIIAVHRRRTWTQYLYVTPDTMKEEDVHTAYNEKGEPVLSSWNAVLLRRVGPFIASKEPSSDFLIHLAENDLWDLIPASSEAQKQAYLRRIAKEVLLDADLIESLDPDPSARQKAKATKAKLKAYAARSEASAKAAKQ